MKTGIAPFVKLMEEWPEGEGCAHKLPGDASDREFYRIGAGGAGSAILMVMAEPRKGGELPFINIGNYLSAIGVSVPRIYAYDEERGLVLLEDAGDSTLQEELRGEGEDVYRKYYWMAVDELVKIHYHTYRDDRGDCVAFKRRFDTKKFLWELDFFMEHTLEGYLGLVLDPPDKASLREEFTWICTSIANLPPVLTHRDYHSRNLLVRGGELVVVDFQDARLGPCQYDLASLLRDSYVILSDGIREEMLEYYISLKKEKDRGPIDRKRFRAEFDLVSVQRCLKAAGTFGYMYMVKGNDSYLQYLQPAFNYVREVVAANESLAPLGKVLFKYLD